MGKEIINIIYIDDDIDNDISYYLEEIYDGDFEKNYEEINFDSEDDYQILLQKKEVLDANIIVIDSSLFVESTVDKLFTGEEFKVILQGLYPFMETIIVSQNDDKAKKFGIIPKYKKNNSRGKDPSQYYDEVLKKPLDESIKKIINLRNMAKKLELNKGIDKVLIEKIKNLVEGQQEYNQLTKNDIDSLISEFIKLKKVING